ncbi:MAG TPA: cytochrome ubiquinol oxidase subunit I [Candidatus Brocadiia bacterium]|nr:cytochrome ubiquinol oxidase subunit I [Candidatus Brocadiales bacterium]
MTRQRVILAVLIFSAILAIVLPFTAFAQEEVEEAVVQYRPFLLGGSARVAVWIVAELHLMFAAFVLGVPMFAVIIELVGVRTKDERYNKLAHELTKLLSASFATTAALGGVLAFFLIGLYPGFTHYMANIFHTTFYIYAFLFFGEAFSLYAYYYSWDRLLHKKWAHLLLGLSLNLFGTALMIIANSWTTFMMSPAGIEKETGQLLSLWDAIANPLWNPINIHRLIANVAFGGFVVGAYAAIKFLGATVDEEKAHYDWMGYTGNFIGLAALIPLPFAGYWLGREIYSSSAVMGNISMGGAFSWAFIIQAVLIGMLFIGANYYLWAGMDRIKGAERYAWWIKYLIVMLFFSIAVWLTPHNLPLSGEERSVIGEQYHPFSKFFGVMAAKNAAVNLTILVTFFSFILYRRANKGQTVLFSKQGKGVKIALIIGAAASVALLAWYAIGLPNVKVLEDAIRPYVWPLVILLGIQGGIVIASTILTFFNRGVFAQYLLFGFTIAISVIYMGIYGFELMGKANLLLRYLSVSQVLIVIACLITNTMIDVAVFSRAQSVGGVAWGRMSVRSQYALILLCVTIVTMMGLMGFVRSGLRLDWHIYGVLRDTSDGAFTPSYAYMGEVVGITVLLFLGLVTFVFWLASLGEKKAVEKAELIEEVIA